MAIKYLVGNNATTETPLSELTIGQAQTYPTDRVHLQLNLADSTYGATDDDTWYPCILQVFSSGAPTRIDICRGYSDTYPAEGLGSVNISCEMHGSSWGGNTMKITTLHAHETYRRMCLGWGWMAHGQYFGICLRGGYKYHTYVNKPLNNTGQIDLGNHSDTNSGMGWQVITSSTTYYDSSNNAYDVTCAPVTSATSTNVTNQSGYWDGTGITASISEDRRIATIRP